MRKIVVIGGGAAGMMAAVTAAGLGASVTLFEKNEKLGKKLYITGKGRCNVTNACDADAFIDHVVTNPRFLYSSFGRFNNWDMYDFLERQGLSLQIERGDRVFPASNKSSDVIRTMQNAMDRAGVKWHLHTAVRSLWKEPWKEPDLPDGQSAEEKSSGDTEDAVTAEKSSRKGRKMHGRKARAEKPRYTGICRGVVLENGKKIPADAVIVATGGLSYPTTGSTGDGYEFARAAGMEVTPCTPSLVPFDAVIGENIPCRELQGLSLRNVAVTVSDDGKALYSGFGEMLFTHFGVSGPLMLSASSEVTRQMHQNGKPLPLVIDLKPALSRQQLDARFLREFEAGANRHMKNVLGAVYPSRLVPVMLRLSGISPEVCAREVTREEREKLLDITKNLPVTLLRTRGFSEAIITQGGVAVREIDPASMESRRVSGLYFAGEVLDVDACTGGFNLQVAWTTGYAAGSAAAKKGTENEPEYCH